MVDYPTNRSESDPLADRPTRAESAALLHPTSPLFGPQLVAAAQRAATQALGVLAAFTDPHDPRGRRELARLRTESIAFYAGLRRIATEACRRRAAKPVPPRRTAPRRLAVRRHRRAATRRQAATGDDSGPADPPLGKLTLAVACGGLTLGFCLGAMAASVLP